MTDAAIITLAQQAIKLCLLLSGPMLITALIVGLIISALQAVTQIQEMTLTFVPKILAMVLVFFLTMPWMLKKLTQFTQTLILSIPQIIR